MHPATVLVEVKGGVTEVRVVKLQALVKVGVRDDLLPACLVHQADGVDRGVVDSKLANEVLSKGRTRLFFGFVQSESLNILLQILTIIRFRVYADNLSCPSNSSNNPLQDWNRYT